jgi:hypothetical protein
MKRVLWSHKLVIAALRRIGAKRFSVARTRHASLFEAARLRFGSWEAAILAAGFKYPDDWKLKKWTRKKILTAIRARARKRLPINTRTANHHLGGLYLAAKREFGSWRTAVARAGHADRLFPWPRFRWTRRALLDHLRSIAKRHGQVSTTLVEGSTPEGYGNPRFAIRRLFGGLAQAKKHI